MATRARSGEALSQPGGSPIALPVDQKLAGQLTAVRFEMTPNGIKAENKDDVVKRLGRSPDRADAVVMCWYKGVTGAYARKLYGIEGSGRKLPKVIRGYEARRP